MDDQKNQSPQTEEHKKQSKRFLAVYIIGLFSVALVLILLSYLTQVRADRQLASKDTQLNEQISATQGAVQKMETLQATSEEQRKQIEAQQKVLDALAATLGVDSQDKLTAEAELLKARYIALDALQQARRMADADDLAGAHEVLEKMVAQYGESRLVPPSGDVLLGQNAAEFQALYARTAAQDEG
ncbi:hypothetical protein LI291_07540 [Intestinibacillus massiliensis]|nr:hypothetical protein [Intestinibacillus massiliensis]